MTRTYTLSLYRKLEEAYKRYPSKEVGERFGCSASLVRKARQVLKKFTKRNTHKARA